MVLATPVGVLNPAVFLAIRRLDETLDPCRGTVNPNQAEKQHVLTTSHSFGRGVADGRARRTRQGTRNDDAAEFDVVRADSARAGRPDARQLEYLLLLSYRVPCAVLGTRAIPSGCLPLVR